MEKGRFKIKPDGKSLDQVGVDYGAIPELIHRAGAYGVAKFPGSMQWSSRGASAYFPTEWCLFEAEFGPDYMEVKAVLERQEPKTLWKKCRDRMIRDANRLAKETK